MNIDILGKKEEKIKMQKMGLAMQRAAEAISLQVTINYTHNFNQYSGSSMNPAQSPHVFIEGNLEISGMVPPMVLIQTKLAEYRDKRSQAY